MKLSRQSLYITCNVLNNYLLPFRELMSYSFFLCKNCPEIKCKIKFCFWKKGFSSWNSKSPTFFLFAIRHRHWNAENFILSNRMCHCFHRTTHHISYRPLQIYVFAMDYAKLMIQVPKAESYLGTTLVFYSLKIPQF